MQTLPSTRDEPARQASDASHSPPRSPRTIAAVLAMFASRQDAAVTLTVRHTTAAGRPVPGSSDVMGIVAPAVCQRRTVVLEVASPPRCSVIHWPGASTPAR